ncbi:hypothetical protein GCM10020218_099110 [Dactylosporangium vinaceum]
MGWGGGGGWEQNRGPPPPPPDAMVFARDGFNVIATANTRDRGVNEMSAALKRRFNFETVFPDPRPADRARARRGRGGRAAAPVRGDRAAAAGRARGARDHVSGNCAPGARPAVTRWTGSRR